MPLPIITHLQFFILDCLRDKELSGLIIREKLVSVGAHKGSAKFYTLMKRLETAKLVTGTYHCKIVDKQMNRQRIYTITALGRARHTTTANFYKELISDQENED